MKYTLTVTGTIEIDELEAAKLAALQGEHGTRVRFGAAMLALTEVAMDATVTIVEKSS